MMQMLSHAGEEGGEAAHPGVVGDEKGAAEELPEMKKKEVAEDHR
jgi:hypothetical protein